MLSYEMSARSAAIAVAAAGGLLLASEPAQAQEREERIEVEREVEVRRQVTVRDYNRFRIDLRAGGTFPTADLANSVDPGFGPGLGLAFALGPRIALRLDGDVSLLRELDGPGDDAARFFQSDVTLWHYGAGLEVDALDPLADWFLRLGLGAGATTIDPKTPGDQPPGVEGSGTETRFTTNGALTVGFRASDRVGIFLRGKTYMVFVDSEQFEDGDGLAQELDDLWWIFPVQLGVEIGVR